MRVRNHVVWFVMRTYQLQSNARWAPPEHHRATELRHIPVLHRGKETMQDEYRDKHIPQCREVILVSPLFIG